MDNFDRRGFLRRTLAGPLLSSASAMSRAGTATPKPTDIRIESVSHHYDDLPLRTPLKFGGRVVTRSTLLTVDCTVRTVDGRTAKGFGEMPLGNTWSFPSAVLTADETLGAMKALADRIVKVTSDYREPGHPIDINCDLEPAYLQAAADVSKELHLAEPIPKLCMLVTASPF